MSPLLRVMSTPVARRSTSKARMGARKSAGSALLFALALALVAISGQRPAGADESVPSTTPQPPSVTSSVPPAADPNAHAEATPGPAPSQNASVKADSVLPAAAVPRDSVSKTQDAGAPGSKDTPPAERAENASAAPGEKPGFPRTPELNSTLALFRLPWTVDLDGAQGIFDLAARKQLLLLRRGLGSLDLIGPTSRFPCLVFIPVRRQHV